MSQGERDGELDIESRGLPRLWRDATFAQVWFGQSATMVGGQFGLLAIPLLAVQTMHATASQVAILNSATTVPFVALSLVAGVVVDRVPRRLSLAGCSALRFAVLVSVPIAAALSELTLAQLLIVALLDGCLNVFWMTAYRSFVPEVVPKNRLQEAYSLVGVSDGVSRTLAPSAVGFAVQILSAATAIVVQSLLYLVSSVAHFTVRQHSERPRASDGPVHPAEGVKFLRSNGVAGRLALAETSYQLFQGIAQGVLVVFLVRSLSLSAGRVGVLLSIGTIGGVLAAATSRRIAAVLGKRTCVFLGCAARSAGLAILPLSSLLAGSALVVVATGLFVNGFGWTLYEVLQDTLQQREIPDKIRGQVNGTILFMSMTGMFVGTVIASLLSTFLRVPLTVAIGATACLSACIWVTPRALRAAQEPL